MVGNPEAIGTLTFRAGYATSRISSILNGRTKQFGWLQTRDFAALGTLMNREEKQQTAAGSLPEIDLLYGWR